MKMLILLALILSGFVHANELQFDPRPINELMACSGIVHEYFHQFDENLDKARKAKRKSNAELEAIRKELIQEAEDLILDLRDIQEAIRKLEIKSLGEAAQN